MMAESPNTPRPKGPGIPQQFTLSPSGDQNPPCGIYGEIDGRRVLICAVGEPEWAAQIVRRWNRCPIAENKLAAVMSLIADDDNSLNKEALTWAQVMERPGTANDGMDTGVTGGRVKLAGILRKLADRDVLSRAKIVDLQKRLEIAKR